ncbi:hypothetical protein DRQ29_03635 [bacterium]|nr:MAG: hypothetical protein DRQ29_03635 [bacterium]
MTHSIESILDREAKIGLLSTELVFLWVEQGQALNSLGLSTRQIEAKIGISKSRASRYMQIASDSRILKQLSKGNLLEGFSQNKLVDLTKLTEIAFIAKAEGKQAASIYTIKLIDSMGAMYKGKWVLSTREKRYITNILDELAEWYKTDETMTTLGSQLRQAIDKKFVIKGWTI